MGKAHLPTHVPFVSIVIAPDSFYVFEEGDPDVSGRQEIPTILRVPAGLIEGAPLQGVEVCPAVDEPAKMTLARGTP